MPSSNAAEAPDQASAAEGILVTELPKFDLDTYIQNYTGRTRFDRLVLIARSCVPLCVEAWKAAVAEAKNGCDVSQYELAWECLRNIAPNEPEAIRDEAWIEATEKTNKAETQRLESELKGYKNNLIKESIRMGNEDLGRHFEAIGDLNEAAEAYTRMRHDASLQKHINECSLHLINVSLHRRDWNMVLTSTSKISGSHSSGDEGTLQTLTRLAAGIACIKLGNYLNAARYLLSVHFAVPPAQYSHIASPNDIAIYGSLTALATMGRLDLQRHVLENQLFRTFLEHEPHIRKAVTLFVSGRYSNCLSILQSYHNDYLLDIYLQEHVRDIFMRIRATCIIEYFKPFSRISVDSLEAAFGVPGQSIENELVSMIRNGQLDARIDARNRLLVAVQPDPRTEMQNKSLQAARLYQREATEQLRRVGLLSAGLEVISIKKDMGDQGATGEVWYEDPRLFAASEGMAAQEA